MYAVFKEAGTPLPRDHDLVDYGFNFDEEAVFQRNDDRAGNADAEMGGH